MIMRRKIFSNPEECSYAYHCYGSNLLTSAANDSKFQIICVCLEAYKKCCIPDCRSNYAPSRKNKIIEKSYVKVFRFPRDANKLDLWEKMMPYRNLNISKDSVICVKH